MVELERYKTEQSLHCLRRAGGDLHECHSNSMNMSQRHAADAAPLCSAMVRTSLVSSPTTLDRAPCTCIMCPASSAQMFDVASSQAWSILGKRIDRDDMTLSDAARHQIQVATTTQCSSNVSSGPCLLAMCHEVRAPCTQVVLTRRCLSDVRGRYRSFLKNT